ncbi:MAG: hypothetical protein KGI07_09805 [Thaumarchaeota archaeon]|nr:hypothetical protein [Nitrososphaerota archaeon]
MSEQIQQLMPESKYVVDDLDSTYSSNDDSKIIKLQNKILKKILFPILKKEYKKEPPLSDKKIKEFFKCCLELSEVTHRKNEFRDLASSDLQVYQHGIDKINQQSLMPPQSKQEGIAIAEILIDYTEIILSLNDKKSVILEKIMEQIDYKDLLKSLYGTLLSFVCLYVLINTPEHQDQEKFSRITRYGYALAQNLDGYIDTLDILTNPEEDAKIRKIK